MASFFRGLLCACVFAGVVTGESRPLPVSPSPFCAASEAARRFDGAFQVNSLGEGSWRCGEKTILADKTGRSVQVCLRGELLAKLTFGGSSGASGDVGKWGSPYADLPDAPAKLTADKREKTITWTKPYADANGKRRVFSWTLRALGSSRFQLDWDRGLTAKECAVLKGKGLPLVFVKFQTKDLQRVVTNGDVCQLKPEDPYEGLSVSGKTGSEFRGVKAEMDKRGDSVRATCPFKDDVRRGSILIDLGESRPVRPAPPPVGGIDFWAEDATHIPLRPGKNLMPNPSFEEGLRYWRWDERSGAPLLALSNGVERIDLTDDASDGHAAMVFPRRGGGAGAKSFPLSLAAGRFVFSFAAKRERGATEDGTIRVMLYSPTRRSVNEFSPKLERRYKPDSGWQRYSYEFQSDGTGCVVWLRGYGVTVDDLQLESGAVATAWEGDPVTAVLETSDDDNTVRNDAPWKAALRLTAAPKVQVSVSCRVCNVYREELFKGEFKVRIPASGVYRIPLDFDGADLGNGVFVLRTDLALRRTGAPLEWTTYQRFERLRPLDGTNPTRELCGTLVSDLERCGRTRLLWRRWKEWGIGGTTWGRSGAYDDPNGSLRKEAIVAAGIRNFFRPVDEDERIRGNKSKGIPEYKHWEAVTPDREQMIEETAYRVVSGADPKLFEYWAMGNEEEGSAIVRRAPGQTRIGQEYVKAQLAARRGILRANPKAKVMPTSGPCNFWPNGNARDAMEAYLREAALLGVKWDAIGVHTYGLLDGSTVERGDLDEATRALIALMDKYEYPSTTPIVYVESFNVPPQVINEWGSSPNNDWYHEGHAGYDFTQRELVHAGALVRKYLLCLKYWPRLKSVNIWMASLHMDWHLMPYAFANAINGFGRRLPDVTFVGDARPYPGVFVSVFRRRTDGKGVAALWTSENAVEYGHCAGTTLSAVLPKDTVAFDAFDNPRRIERTAKGAQIPLTPLPLYLESSDPDALLSAIKKSGRDEASVRRGLESAQAVKNVRTVTASRRTSLGWNGVPSVPLDREVGIEFGKKCSYIRGEKDCSAVAQIVWNDDVLRLRVEVKDSDFLTDAARAQKDPEAAQKRLYGWDGCLEVYFDCGDNARRSYMNDYDTDDYRYDFAPPLDGRSGPGRVWRLVEVDHQMANGLDMPSKEDAMREIPCKFERTADGYAYEIEFPARFLLPMRLKKGTTVGFGLYVHDRDTGRPSRAETGVALMDSEDGVCDHNPKGWVRLRLEGDGK